MEVRCSQVHHAYSILFAQAHTFAVQTGRELNKAELLSEHKYELLVKCLNIINNNNKSQI